MSSFNKKLSIIIPVYNEKHTIQKILNKIYNLKNLKKEIIVINDASTDGTKEILNRNKKKITYLIHHKKNLGKGAAIQTAKKFIKGDVVIIQDADLEYDPGDYMKLLNLIIKGNNVVYGSRVLGKNRYLSKNFSSILRIFYNHYSKFEESPHNFNDKYFSLLESGGSRNYQVLLAEFDLDPKNKNFWQLGMNLIKNLLDELERIS